MDKIRVNNVEIDKYEVYEYLWIILKKHYKNYQEKDDKYTEEIYIDTCDFIRAIIGEDNVDDFIEYTSDNINILSI